MSVDISNLSLKQKAILSGLFLSKFDMYGLVFLGFNNFKEAYNALGFALGVSPASIKNYRDEFDPLFPNKRKGWHKRERRAYCMELYESFGMVDIDELSEILKEIIYQDKDLDILFDEIKKDAEGKSSFAKRLITGQAAESYFKESFLGIDAFRGYELEDTTKYGCGFDFKLYSENKDFLGVEVKGLNGSCGTISLTNKEHKVAEILGDRYYLFIVKNFTDKPYHEYCSNPLSHMSFDKKDRYIQQTTWQIQV